jgi:hypothetical protein
VPENANIYMAVIGKPFEKGNQAGKLKAGKNHKKTAELKNLIDSFLDETFDQVAEAFQSLTPKEQCQMYVGLLQYRLPKKASMEVEPVRPIPDEYQALDFKQLEEIEQIVNRANS